MAFLFAVIRKYLYLCTQNYNIELMNDKEKLTRAIKTAIKEHGFTLTELAEKMTDRKGVIGVNQSAITQIIKGNPTLNKLIEIANIVGCSVPELLGGTASVPNDITVIIDGQQYNYELSDCGNNKG